MKLKKKEVEQYLFLLQRSQLNVFRKSNGKIGTWKFDSKVVDKLEIKDLDLFIKTFTAFLNQMKLSSGEVTLLLDSSIYFTQEIPSNADAKKTADQLENDGDSSAQVDQKRSLSSFEQNEAEMEAKRKFVQSVPFSNTYSNIIEFNKSKLIIVANRDLYEPIIKVLTEREFRVTHIFPMAVVGEIFDHGGYTPEAALMLLHSIDKYKAGDLMQSKMVLDTDPTTSAGDNQKMTAGREDKKRLYLMLGTFFALLIVLGGVIFWSMRRDQTPPVVPSPAVIESESLQPAAVESDQAPLVETRVDLQAYLTSTESALENIPALEVRIDCSGDADQQAKKLQAVLSNAGMQNVQVNRLATTTYGPVTIKVSEDVPLLLQELLVDELMKLDYQAKVQAVDHAEQIDILVVLTAG